MISFMISILICTRQRVNVSELKSGSRIREVGRERPHLSETPVNEPGLSLEDGARRLGVAPAAIANADRRQKNT